MRSTYAVTIFYFLFLASSLAHERKHNARVVHRLPPTLLSSTSHTSWAAPEESAMDVNTLHPCDTSVPDTHHSTQCGQGFCYCSDNLANCSHQPSLSPYVPPLPATILGLMFNFNGLVAIGDDFFLNATSLEYVNFDNTQIVAISHHAFLPLPNLTRVTLRNTSVSYNILGPVLSMSSLKLLDISDNGLGNPPDGIFQNYPMPQLEVLCLNRNFIYSVNMSVFRPLTSLRYLSIYFNALSSATLVSDYLPQLTGQLRLCVNSFYQFPETCRNGESLYPNLAVLFIRSNRIVWMPRQVCLPALRYLHLEDNFVSWVHTDMFNNGLFPSLKYLDLTSTIGGILEMQPHAFRHPSLETLVLINCKITLNDDKYSADALAGSPNLSFVTMDENHVWPVTEKKFSQFFRGVERLQLKSNEISELTPGMLDSLPLTYLNLADNRLSSIPDGVFDRLRDLEWLVLSNNSITLITESTFGADIRNRLRELDLDGNPFLCSCDLLWFQNWYQTSAALRTNSSLSCDCGNIPNTTLQSFYISQQACLLSRPATGIIIFSVLVAMLVLLVVIVVYRYRWHIKLILYDAFRGRRDRWRRLQRNHFRYDVFVSFDIDDAGWVCQHLVPELEGRLGLRLCVHQRDFTPGEPVVKNIVESVENSRQVLMIFSTSFSHSPWCQFELTLCLSHVMDQGDTLLVVLLQRVPSRDLTPAMIAVMETTTYMEWPDDTEAQASFWARMRLALKDTIQAPRTSNF